MASGAGRITPGCSRRGPLPSCLPSCAIMASRAARLNPGPFYESDRQGQRCLELIAFSFCPWRSVTNVPTCRVGRWRPCAGGRSSAGSCCGLLRFCSDRLMVGVDVVCASWTLPAHCVRRTARRPSMAARTLRASSEVKADRVVESLTALRRGATAECWGASSFYSRLSGFAGA